MSLKQVALKGVFWAALQKFSNQIISFGISIIMARLLLPEEFGLIAMLAVFMGVGRVFIDSGLSQSLIRTSNPDQSDFSTVFYFNLVVSVAVYALISLCAPYIATFYKQPELTSITRVYCIIFVINAFATIQTTRLNKLLDFKTQMLVSLPSILLYGVVGVLLAVNGLGVWSLVWAAIAQSLANTIQLWFWSGWRPQWTFSKEKFKIHFNFGSKLMVSFILNEVFKNIYTLVIGKYFAAAQVGFYAKANGLKQQPVNLISGIVGKITYPLFSEIQNDDKRLKDVYKRIMQLVMFLVAPTLIFLGVLAEPIFRFLYTEKWLPAVPFFQILCILGILEPIHGYNLQILNVKGRSDLFLKLSILKKAIVTIILVITIPLGIIPMLWGAVVGSLLSFFINTFYSGKFINYTAWQQSKDLAPFILVALAAAGCFYAIETQTAFGMASDIVRILVGLFVCGVLYLSMGYVFKWSVLFEIRNFRK